MGVRLGDSHTLGAVFNRMGFWRSRSLIGMLIHSLWGFEASSARSRAKPVSCSSGVKSCLFGTEAYSFVDSGRAGGTWFFWGDSEMRFVDDEVSTRFGVR